MTGTSLDVIVLNIFFLPGMYNTPSRIAINLIFVSVVLFIFGIIQALLSLLGAYGS